MKFLHEYLRYSGGTIIDNGWWEISEDGTRLINIYGGWHNYTPREDDIVVEADSWYDLDWSHLLKPDSPYGWIDRDGKWYGCGYQNHSAVAEFVLGKTERDLEESGWVKLYRRYNGETDWYMESDQGIRNRITQAQIKTLKEHGIYEKWFD